MNKFFNTYLTYRKKTYIEVYTLFSTDEFKYYDLSDHNLNLSDYKLTSGYYDSIGRHGWWIDFYSSGHICELDFYKNNIRFLEYHFTLQKIMIIYI